MHEMGKEEVSCFLETVQQLLSQIMLLVYVRALAKSKSLSCQYLM